jgi:hypothetical protein
VWPHFVFVCRGPAGFWCWCPLALQCLAQNNGNVTPSPFNDMLGPNGYYVFSAYDLDPKPEDGGFMYNTPDEVRL